MLPSSTAGHSPGRFDTLADAYDRYRIGYAPELYEVLYESGLHAGTHVLDVATGTGLVASALVERGLHVTGIDISEPMLARAHARVPDASFRVASAEALPFGEDTFGAGVSAQAFHWFDRPRALAELIRVVRPGGTIAIWWKELMRGDAVRLLREEVSHSLGVDTVRSALSEEFDAFYESALVDRRLRVIPWIVSMRVGDFLGYERSRARARESYGERLEEYIAILGERLGPPEEPLSLAYVHLLYLGRVPEHP
jgi:ubiquinone/menaquinone biosynthesis C-methylase UbiE